MTITSVTVRRLKSLGNFNHIAIEATAQVQDGESPVLVRQDLDLWVQAQIEEGKSMDDLRDEVADLIRQKADLMKEIDAIKRDIFRLQNTPLKELQALTLDEIPF